MTMMKVVDGKPVPMTAAEEAAHTNRPPPPYQRPSQLPADALQTAIDGLLSDMAAEGVIPAAKATTIAARFRARRG